MAKNKGKGGKNRRRGKNETDSAKRELILKEGGQEYAQVRRMLGNGRLEAMCIDGQQRLCHIRGKLRKKVWINVGDLVLLGLRDFQDNKADVILRYLPEEARQLKNLGHIPAHISIADVAATGIEKHTTDDVIFDDDAEGAAVSSEDNDDDASDSGSNEDAVEGDFPTTITNQNMKYSSPDEEEDDELEEEEEAQLPVAANQRGDPTRQCRGHQGSCRTNITFEDNKFAWQLGTLLQDLSKKLRETTGDERAGQNISHTVQRGNAASVIATAEEGEKLQFCGRW
ncbi:hypothetical protein ACOME3_009859 [Neoechinorhynchus agilis]